MKRQSLWRISISTSSEAEEAVAELLIRSFGLPICSFTNTETGQSSVGVYLDHKPVWSRARRATLAAGLKRIESCGLDLGAGRILLSKVRWKNWAESWKRHFRPMEFGTALLVKPGWSKRRARKGQAVVRLVPGLSFGTGQHATTGFCLQQLVARRTGRKAQSFLDIGT